MDHCAGHSFFTCTVRRVFLYPDAYMPSDHINNNRHGFCYSHTSMTEKNKHKRRLPFTRESMHTASNDSHMTQIAV